MAPSKRKAPLTRRPRKPKTAQLRPRSSIVEDSSPQAKVIKPATVKKPRKKKVLTINPPKPFRLLDLAPELRILVYEKVLENHPVAKLSRSTSHRELSSTSALPRVSKQVRDEFLNVVMTSVPIVQTVVKNFRFAHIITFLNRLSDIELERMTAGNATRTLLITLEFPDEYPDFGQLHRWLNRSEHPTKKGAKIDFQYVSAKKFARVHAGPSYQIGPLPALKLNDGRLEAIKIRSAVEKR